MLHLSEVFIINCPASHYVFQPGEQRSRQISQAVQVQHPLTLLKEVQQAQTEIKNLIPTFKHIELKNSGITADVAARWYDDTLHQIKEFRQTYTYTCSHS
jgi:hypothetical protein